jgi:hypothetical protein
MVFLPATNPSVLPQGPGCFHANLINSRQVPQVPLQVAVGVVLGVGLKTPHSCLRLVQQE